MKPYSLTKPNSNERVEFPTNEYRLSKLTIDTYMTNQKQSEVR